MGKHMAVAVFSVWALKAEVIDRIAITVDRLVITESELRRQISLTAFMNGKPPEFSSKTRRDMAEKLIEQALIRNEMKLTRYPQPESYESDESVEEIRRQYKGEGEYLEALKQYGLDERDLRAYLLWR